MTRTKYYMLLLALIASLGAASIYAQNQGNTNPGQQSNQNEQNKLQTQNQNMPTNQALRDQNDIDVVLARAKSGIFGAVLSITGKDTALMQNGPFTVFAPSDDAAKKLPNNILEKLTTDSSKLNKTVNNHIVANTKISSSDIGRQDIKTVDGMTLNIQQDSNGNTTVNGQRVIEGVQYSNGVVYIIDGTILPNDL